MTVISGSYINISPGGPHKPEEQELTISIDKVTTRMTDWRGADKQYFTAKQSAFKLRFVEAR